MSRDLPARWPGGFFMAGVSAKNGRSARRITVYDTTLRDGAQGSGVSFSVADKLLIARALDRISVDYVEGGFPGSNPKDEEFFAALAEAPLKKARLAAFGATRRAGGTCDDDANLAALARSGAPTWTLVGKSDTWQVDKVLQTTVEENLAMIRESVAFGVASGHEVIFDAEHFFDGFTRDRDYALEVCATAAQAGATWVVLCDTNGGSLPSKIRAGVEAVVARLGGLGAQTPESGDHRLDAGADLRRQASAVRVAKHDPCRSRLRGGGADLQRVVAVARESVEEVLGVEDDLMTRRHAKRHRLADHREVLLDRRLQHLVDLPRVALADQCPRRSSAARERREVG